MSSSGERDRIDAMLDQAERQPFVGWDFSWLRGRLDSQPLPGGWFMTPQVAAGNDLEYRALFGIESPEPDPKSRWAWWLPGQLERAGLRVVAHASAPLVQVVRDVGALAWGLKAIPWMVPGFSIDKYRARLREIQAQIDRDGPITVRQRRFWARAQKRS